MLTDEARHYLQHRTGYFHMVCPNCHGYDINSSYDESARRCFECKKGVMVKISPKAQELVGIVLDELTKPPIGAVANQERCQSILGVINRLPDGENPHDYQGAAALVELLLKRGATEFEKRETVQAYTFEGQRKIRY